MANSLDGFLQLGGDPELARAFAALIGEGKSSPYTETSESRESNLSVLREAQRRAEFLRDQAKTQVPLLPQPHMGTHAHK
jgi:hypothetical protein